MKSLAVMDFSTCSINIRLDRAQYLESCVDEVPGSDGLLNMLHYYQVCVIVAQVHGGYTHLIKNRIKILWLSITQEITKLDMNIIRKSF
jgi:hypothetical protein